MTHLIRGSFEWFTVLLCFLVVEVSNEDFGMETKQKPVNEKSLKIRIHHKTNENILSVCIRGLSYLNFSDSNHMCL